jgi:hypothetical protein
VLDLRVDVWTAEAGEVRGCVALEVARDERSRRRVVRAPAAHTDLPAVRLAHRGHVRAVGHDPDRGIDAEPVEQPSRGARERRERRVGVRDDRHLLPLNTGSCDQRSRSSQVRLMRAPGGGSRGAVGAVRLVAGEVRRQDLARRRGELRTARERDGLIAIDREGERTAGGWSVEGATLVLRSSAHVALDGVTRKRLANRVATSRALRFSPLRPAPSPTSR